MTSTYLRDLMRECSSNGKGEFAMLVCHLDDSGTHDGSKALIWAGISGEQPFFEQLEKAWNARLADPCDGHKPPISKFSSFSLANGRGEFASYDETARNLTRRNFAQIIIDSSLSWVSYGISLDAWNKHANVILKNIIGTPEKLVFGKLILNLCESAKKHGDAISFHFDKGREQNVISILQPAIDESNIDNSLVRYTFSPVSKNVGLQAADLIANETYRYFKGCVDNPNAKPDLSLQKLIDGAFFQHAAWFGEKEIIDTSKEANASYEKMINSLPSSDAIGER